MGKPELPQSLSGALWEELARLPCEMNTVGLSGAGVYCYRDSVLKISKDDQEARRERQMLLWLQGKLPVPRVLDCRRVNGRQYLLMSRLPGTMLCDPSLMNCPEQLMDLIAQGLKQLWSVSVADCPSNQDLEHKLAAARRRVLRGQCDTEHVQPGTYGPDGFSSPMALLEWLETHRPAEELRLSHGDFCLPNVFAENGSISGFLDLGRCGLSDPYQDIALAYRSLQNNSNGTYTDTVYEGIDPERLFAALGMEPDREKLRYYTLLDELF